MATVKITDKLLDAINREIGDMRNRALAKISAFPDFNADQKDAILEAAVDLEWGVHRHLRGQIPDEWCSTPNYLTPTFTRRVGDNDVNLTVDYPRDEKVLLPPGEGRGAYQYTIKIPEQCIPARALAEVNDTFARLEERRLISKRYKELNIQLRAFLRKFVSLNVAIKEMPELEMYIPAEYKARLNRPTYRSRPAPKKVYPDVEVDKDELVGLAVADRLNRSVR